MIIGMENSAGRARTAAARRARTMAKYLRWAQEMRNAGWIVGKSTQDIPQHLDHGALWELKKAVDQRCDDLGMLK